ncbi:MAG: hypothetical protein Q4D27_04710 [Coriobacteriia bacterium]|nr:hypothetical protein [Coriobacteriia bacterium]
MAERNQDVLDMIAQLRARLMDLEEDVRAFDGDLPGMATRLDRIDDRIYLLETEVASRSDAAAKETEAPQPQGEEKVPQAATEQAAEKGESGDDNGLNILTPEAKEKIGEFAGDLRSVAKTGAETLADLNEAFSDITSPFKAFTKSGRRR